jgi:DNA recombination protein RmuC
MLLLAGLAVGLVLGALLAWLYTRGQMSALQVTLDHERARTDEKVALLDDAKQDFAAKFDALAADALRKNNESFLALAAGKVQPIADGLKKMSDEVNLLEQSRQRDQGALAKSVETLLQTNDRVRVETAALATALRSSEVRGAWGQMQLRNAVETAGMLAYCDFEEEVHVAHDGRSLRPDMVVRLPGGRKIVIDAKTPLKPLLDAMDAPEAEPDRYLDDFVRHVRRHAKQLSEKAYWEQFGKDSPDYVFMFLANEGLYRTAIERDPSLLEIAGGQRVILVSPMSLITMLRTIACIWSDARVAESAEKVSELGRELYERLVTMTVHLDRLGNKLNGAVADYNQTIGSFERRVLPSARKFTEHGIAPKKALPELEPIEIAAQPPQTIELPAAKRDAA